MSVIFKEAATTLKSYNIGLAAIDATAEENKDLKEKYDIKRFPTFKINNTKFGDGLNNTGSFKTAHHIVDTMLKASKPLIQPIDNISEVSGYFANFVYVGDKIPDKIDK